MTGSADAPPTTLPDVLADGMRRLSRGVADRRSPFHTPSVATIGMDGRPRQRVVVLRAFAPEGPALRFHTDGRSEKIAELAQDPRVALLAYDAGAKVQVRLEGVATIHADDAIADSAWSGSRMFSRACYGTQPAPGSAIDDGSSFSLPADDHEILAGRVHFRAVMVRVERLEWLYLHHGGHRRAAFDFTAGGEPAMRWLVP